MKKVLLSVTAAVALSGVAMAGGDIAPVAPAPADSWSGFYVGAQFGYVMGDTDVDVTFGPLLLQSKGMDLNGATEGLFAGYNWKFENDWLVGLEAGMNFMSQNDSSRLYRTSGAPTPLAIEVKQDWEASIVARVGKVIDDTYLPYLLGGATWTKLESRYVGSVAPSGFAKWKNDTVSGFTLGAGIEAKITENFHARLEYRYNNYGDAHTKHSRTAPPLNTDESIDYNSNVVTVGFIYRF